MACLIVLITLLFLLFFSLSSAGRSHPHLHPTPPNSNSTHNPNPTLAPPAPPKIIQQACKATRFPDSCQTSLTQSSNLNQTSKPTDVVQAAMSVSAQNLKTAQSMVKTIFDASSDNLNRSRTAMICLEVLHNSEYRISSATDVFPIGRIKDARAWMSAGLLANGDSK